jgi:hypothetical protein
MDLEHFTKMRALEAVYSSGAVLDRILTTEDAPKLIEELKLKRIQFDASPLLSEKLENMCVALQCSKREFLEMAVLDAIQRADQIFGQTIKSVMAE